jgi:hypothetical protein
MKRIHVFGRSAGLLIAALALARVATAVELGEADGKLVVNGKSLKLSHAVAVSGPDTFDGTKQAFIVLLTPKPIAPASIAAANSVDAIRALVDPGLVIKIGAEGSEHITIRHPKIKGELQTSGLKKTEVARMDAQQVVGTVSTSGGKDEDMPGDAKVRYKIAFAAPVVRAFPLEKPLELAKNARKLGAGGGAPGRAFLAEKCQPRPNLKDRKAVEAYLTKMGMMPTDADLAQMSKEKGHSVTKPEAIDMAAQMLEAADAFGVKNCRVLGGEEDGKIAILEVEATTMGERMRTDFTLVKEGGVWKVRKEGAWREIPKRKR